MIGIDFETRELSLLNKKVKFLVFDNCRGQEKYRLAFSLLANLITS